MGTRHNAGIISRPTELPPGAYTETHGVYSDLSSPSLALSLSQSAMADEFQTGICSGSGGSGGNWWNSSRSSSPCSTALTDIGGYGWTPEMARSSDETASISSVSFPEKAPAPASVSVTPTTVLMDSTLQMTEFGLSSPSIDWSQALLRSSGRAESNFQAMLQEAPMESTEAHKEWSPKIFSSGGEESMNTFKQINQAFVFDPQRPNSSAGECTVTCQGLPSSNFAMASASYGCPSPLLQGLFDQDPQSYESRGFPMNYRLNQSEVAAGPYSKFPQFLKTSPPKQLPPSNHQLHFSNNTPYWNATAAAINDVRSSFYPPSHSQFLSQSLEEKPNSTALPPKINADQEARDSSTAMAKKGGGELGFKRPRIETPSPLPTFKVRKEKLGDRITALQQLVSPFGKTDTASVLYEAIEYIKFLHEQVTVLSTAYMKNGTPMQYQQSSDKSKEEETQKQDLRSRGLCLVPISSTFPVTNETTADFWTPTFGGTYR